MEKRRDDALSSLNVAIEAVNLAKEVSSITPAKAVFGSVSVLLTMIRDSMVNKTDYVELGLACADVCRALDRGMNGRRVDGLSRSVFEAISQLTTAVAEIQKNIIQRGERNRLSRMFHAKNDKETIATWRSDLNRILHVFNTELAINTHTIVSDIQRTIVESREGADGKHRSSQSSTLGESPPPPPRACFGREDLIEQVVGFAENLAPIALIGAGGIGKTSIALAVLHHDRIKKRFGANRRFIRCDQFPASGAHFLSRLSKVIGAGVENPEDLTPLRPLLFSREMILVLDNAESLLDPQGASAREISTMVEELSQFETVCLCVTSRISTVPRHCKRPIIPTLSMESACDVFYAIYDNGGRSDIISNLLGRLDFHALSITLLATTASHNMWDHDRLAQEWDARRTQVLRTDYDESLAATIELSLASPTFCKLGPDARDLLGVVAFFPQGINEDNLDWLFPTISNGKNMFDKFCSLSLTYRSNGFVTMLAPLRDHLCLKDPMSSPLLQTTKECYFTRLSVPLYPGKPSFDKAQWIISEDVNVEYLLDVFIVIDAASVIIWDTCAHFMRHMYWHKPRLVVLGPKIERLPDDHPSKARCLVWLSSLFIAVGNNVERKRLLVHSLKLQRGGGGEALVARTLQDLSDANRILGHYEEGIYQAKEALEIHERLKNISGQVYSLNLLAWLYHDNNQLDAAESAALRATSLLPNEGRQHSASRCHRTLGMIYRSKGETGAAIEHLETALAILSHFNWHQDEFLIRRPLAEVFLAENRFDDARPHIEQAKLHATNHPRYLGRAMELQAKLWFRECRFEEAKSEALRAIDIYGKVGTMNEVEGCRKILKDIEEQMKKPVTSGG